jgi:hypothetical protein
VSDRWYARWIEVTADRHRYDDPVRNAARVAQLTRQHREFVRARDHNPKETIMTTAVDRLTNARARLDALTGAVRTAAEAIDAEDRRARDERLADAEHGLSAAAREIREIPRRERMARLVETYRRAVVDARAQRTEAEAELAAAEAEVDGAGGTGERHDAAWRRAVARLDAGEPAGVLATEAAQRRDLDTLTALRVELPAWSAARAVAMARTGKESSRKELRERAAQETARVSAELDGALARLGSGDVARAATERIRAKATAAELASLTTDDQVREMTTDGRYGRGSARVARALAANDAARETAAVGG